MGKKIALTLVRLIAEAIGFSPRPFQLMMGRALGRTLRVFGYRRKVVFQNLERAFPGDSATAREARERVFHDFYYHLGNLFLEILIMFGPFQSFVEKNVEVRGLKNWLDARKSGRGILMFSGHLGNWEVLAGALAQIAKIDFLIVTKTLKPLWVHQAFEEARGQCHVRATYEPKTFRDVLSQLKLNQTVGMAIDQYAGPPVGIRVPFFGIPVGTHSAFATVAKRTGSVILPMTNYRTPEGKFIVEIFPEMTWKQDPDSHREIALNTAQISEIWERQVLRHPEQWLWTHQRFKGNLGPLSTSEWDKPRTRSG